MENREAITTHFDSFTPRPGPQQCGGRPPALLGAGGEPVHGSMHMSDGGAEGDLVQNRQATGRPSTLAPGRDRSVTPRRGACDLVLRGGSLPPERANGLRLSRMAFQQQMSGGRDAGENFWCECTEDALRT